MCLADIFPRNEIVERFDEEIIFSAYTLDEIEGLVALKGSSVFELGVTVWDRYVQRHPDVNPQQFADYFDADDPGLYQAVAELLGEATVNDLYYVHAELADTEADYRSVAELLIAVAYPNVIHISDIEFSNPREPIPPAEQQYAHQHFRGLGLLPTLMANATAYGQQHGIDAICLTAAAVDLVPLFEAHGFVVDDTPAGQLGLMIGGSVPMTKPLV